MSIASRAQWIIERNLSEDISLASIADACGVSKFHLARAFSARAGLTVLRYVRARRLSAAAGELMAGQQDILSLALATGYGSHEAFTRAFKDYFGLTPEQVRSRATLPASAMMRPPKLTEISMVSLSTPRYESLGPLLLVGLTKRQNTSEPQAIAAQWQEFMQMFSEIQAADASVPLGVSANMDDEGWFDYTCAVPVTTSEGAPKALHKLKLPKQRYVVFVHDEHISKLPETYAAIWNEWFPSQGRRPSEGATLERHGKSFNPRTGLGGVEVLIPVRAAS